MPPTTLTLACACQTITASIPLPPSTTTLPLPLEICHCASCRHASGQLAITCFPCPRFPPNDPNNPNQHHNNNNNNHGAPTLTITSPAQPTAYKTSADLIRYFCPKCGASIYIENTASGEVEVCSGVLGPVDLKEGEGGLESVVRFARHIFLGNTRDGGMGVWVAGPRWRGWADGEVFEVPEAGEGGGVVGGGGSGGGGKRRLRGYCHCRGVEFYVTPPDDEEEDKHAEFSSGAEKKDPQWYLRASGTKYLAGLCACNSCRLATGHDLQSWAFIPHSHIHRPDGTVFNLHPEGSEGFEGSEGKGNTTTTTTLKTYSHTPGAKRGFCGRCGATVFWSHEERRGDVIDISVGLLEEEGEGGGARVEGWLEWRTEGVGFAECALNKQLVGMVVEGLGKWGEGRGKVGG